MELIAKQEIQYIAFATEYGVVGKDVFTILSASLLHYNMGYNVVVVDCDYPKYQIFQMRNKDIELVETDKEYASKYNSQQEKLQKHPYTVLCSPAESAIDVVDSYLDSCQEHIDFVIFNLPNIVRSVNVLKCIACLDYLFIPIVSDRSILDNSLSFAVTIKQMFADNPKYTLKDILLFWNMVDEKERTDLYDLYNNSMPKLGLHILQNRLPNIKRFKKELRQGVRVVFCSTIFPPNTRMLRSSRFDLLLEEIIKVINV
ncbi:MAG: ParA family protein [Rikenellaceae bacterium]